MFSFRSWHELAPFNYSCHCVTPPLVPFQVLAMAWKSFCVNRKSDFGMIFVLMLMSPEGKCSWKESSIFLSSSLQLSKRNETIMVVRFDHPFESDSLRGSRMEERIDWKRNNDGHSLLVALPRVLVHYSILCPFFSLLMVILSLHGQNFLPKGCIK